MRQTPVAHVPPQFAGRVCDKNSIQAGFLQLLTTRQQGDANSSTTGFPQAIIGPR
jgi:hypothetical protein